MFESRFRAGFFVSKMIEFQEFSTHREIKSFIQEIELTPEWENVIALRSGIRRLMSIRGRLIGEQSHDKGDLLYDATSFQQKDWKTEDVSGLMKILVLTEAAYYKYAENFGRWCARDSGYPERTEDYKDMAKELVAWSVWFRWRPGSDIHYNNLHTSVMGALKYLPQAVHKSYLSNSPFSNFFEGIVDTGKKVDYSEGMTEMPEYRLRRAIGEKPLGEIFASLDKINSRERLSILCVMGYIPEVVNLTQGIRRFKVDPSSFRASFDSGLEKLTEMGYQETSKEAHEIVDEAVNRGIIRDPNGTVSPINSPRLRLLGIEDTKSNLEGRELDLLQMATELERNVFRYSLSEMGEKLGGLSKTAVSKRIKRIADKIFPVAP